MLFRNKSVILYDAAYEAYISDPEIPHSIYEIEGANEVAIEFRSLSKTAGFTGTSCAYTIIPKNLVAFTADGDKKTFVSALVQKTYHEIQRGILPGPESSGCHLYTRKVKKEVRATIGYYMNNAKILA